MMKTFSNSTCYYLNIFYIPFIFYYWQQVLFTLRISSLLSPLNDAFFSFLLKLNSHHLYTFTSLLQQTLKQNQCASHNCYSVKNILKLLAFKWLLNEVLLETKLSEVMLIWWFVSVKSIRPFLKFSFFNMFFQMIPLVISTSLEKLNLFHLQISLW